MTEKINLPGKPREKCGVFAIYNYEGPGRAAFAVYLGLLALQHRGQESAGITYFGNKGLVSLKGMGLVEKVFSRKDLLNVGASTVIGHVRYSTTGASSYVNIQPLMARFADQSGIALSHNGNLVNTKQLQKKLLEEGHIFHSTSDTEIMLTYLSRYRDNGMVKAVEKTMSLVEGAYAAVALDSEGLTAFRDPHGFRPLVIGRLGRAFIIASETAALDALGADFIRDIEPGEIVRIEGSKLKSSVIRTDNVKPSPCIFEYIYFARPDSNIDGRNVHLIRKSIGQILAKRLSFPVDMVVPSPDSGVSAAMGMAEALGKPLEWAIYRNPYLGRTFIEPTQQEREMAVKLKFNPVSHIITGKRIAVVDDSLVRGTTAKVLTNMLKSMGAAEVHLAIASPPYRYPCFYGIDIPVAGELAFIDGNKIKFLEETGAASITFAEPCDLLNVLEGSKKDFCTACFTGIYPNYNTCKEKGEHD